MKQYGLIGYPLSHSFSKKFFEQKFIDQGLHDHEFINFELNSIDKFTDLLSNQPNLSGLSVTIPYKEAIIPFLDELDSTAKEVEAVNTIKITKSNNSITTKGFNTDVFGFEESLKPHFKTEHYKALILGSGGASKAVAFVLKKLGIAYQIVSRSKGDILYKNIDKQIIEKHLLIVNTTPLGMFPNFDTSPAIPYHYLGKKHLVFDLVYNPAKSSFLSQSEKNGAQIVNGLKMLELQADKAWTVWNS